MLESAPEWLQGAIDEIQNWEEKADKYQRKLEEQKRPLVEYAEEIAGDLADKLSEVIPEELNPEDTCL